MGLPISPLGTAGLETLATIFARPWPCRRPAPAGNEIAGQEDDVGIDLAEHGRHRLAQMQARDRAAAHGRIKLHHGHARIDGGAQAAFGGAAKNGDAVPGLDPEAGHADGDAFCAATRKIVEADQYMARGCAFITRKRRAGALPLQGNTPATSTRAQFGSGLQGLVLGLVDQLVRADPGHHGAQLRTGLSIG
jgi:hypothetical protein